MKELNEMTYDDFRKLPYFIPDKEQTFNSVVIVPLPKTHDSGYSCMKLILLNAGRNIVGVVGGYTDVMRLLSGNPYSWNIDCLNKSKCIRLFTKANCCTSVFIGESFIITALK